MKKRKKNGIEIYIESFLMTTMFGFMLVDAHQEIKKLEFPSVFATDDLVTLNDTSTSIILENIEEDDIISLIRKAVDSKLDELNNNQVKGTVTPVVTGSITQYNEKASETILTNQFETIAEGMINAEIDNNYSGMKVSHEIEDYIRQTCIKYSEKYNIDYNRLYKIVMTIGYRESAGEWNNNGVWSTTNDVGLLQINTCNAKEALDVCGYTIHDLQYNPYANIDYGTYKVCQIIKLSTSKSDMDVYGTWNGWVKWRQKPGAVNYAEGCMRIEMEYFPELVNNKMK